MDAEILLVVANKTCPQLQTLEHLAAFLIMILENIIILRNKVDLMKPDADSVQHDQIQCFPVGTMAHDAPVIVCKYLVHFILVPLQFLCWCFVSLSFGLFDASKSGQGVLDLQVSMSGWSILQVLLRVGDDIKLHPRVVIKYNGRNS